MHSLKTRLDPWSVRLLAIVAAAPLLHCGGTTTGGEDDGGGPNIGADGGTAGKNGSGATTGSGATGSGTTGSGGFVSTGAGGQAGGIATGGVGAVSGSGGVAGEGGSGGTAGTGGVAGEGGEGGFPCKNPMHIEGVDGYEQCDGFKHRPEVVTCTSILPRPTDWTPDEGDLCEADTDCTERPHGYCSPNGGQGEPGGLPVRVCHYGCTVDSDCAAGSICLCGPVIGACVTSSCTSDAQCGDGLLCASVFNNICMESGFACQHPDDECASNSDCPTEYCQLEQDGIRRCSGVQCSVVGRPFLIDDAARLSARASRADWTSSDVELDARPVTAAEREALGAAWLRNALMEHASVAAFARFTLELLAVGAPADLIRDSNAATSDETRHAELCFALASEYLGEPVGPGPLRIDGALDGISLEKLLVTTIAEGCVGETVAAIEAAEQLAHASDPVVRSVLSRISDDETRHAELAWRFVSWALEQQPSLREVAAREFERHLSTPVSFSDESELDLVRHGVLSAPLRVELRRAVLDLVVRPCAARLTARSARSAQSSLGSFA